MRIIDCLFNNYYSKTKNGDLDLTKVLLNKEFAIHYPFHVLQPTKYKATYMRLFLMRLFCYQGLVTMIFLYGLRVWYESMSGLSEFEGHVFLDHLLDYIISERLGCVRLFSRCR